MSAEKISRYPGIRSFEQYEQDIFYGREKEAEELHDLVNAHPVVVMFAKSGLGKTSLLKAGLMPRLKNVEPFIFRFQDTQKHPLAVMKEAIRKIAYQPKLKEYASVDPDLWELLKSRELNYYEEVKTPLLIFDQFEELFAHPKNHRDDFTRELYYLIEEKVPDAVEQKFRQTPRENRTVEYLAWNKPVNLKILFIIRSDKLHHFQEISKKISRIYQTRFELLPLKIDQAEKAVIKPARLQNEKFKTRPFEYQPVTISAITDNLKNGEEEIEPSQLQILCQYIENRIFNDQQNGVEPLLAKAEYLRGKDGIEQILNGFYNNSINALREKGLITENEVAAAHRLIEDKLIYSGRRVRFDEPILLEEPGVTRSLLDNLVETRIIRVEKTPLGNAYEISHDTLVTPILKEKEKRVAKHKRSLTKNDWEIITHAIHYGKCIFIIGSNLYKDKTGQTLAAALRNFLDIGEIGQSDLIYYSDEELFQFKDARQRTKTYYQIYKFYRDTQPDETCRLIARLPSTVILSLTPDLLLKRTLEQAAIPFQHFCANPGQQLQANFSGRNNQTLLIDLLGSVEDSESMILTNQDAFEYVGSLAGGQILPAPILSKIEAADVFILLGVDFGKWYLRPLFWKILGATPAIKYTVGKSEAYQQEIEIRYKNIFNLDFIDESEIIFLEKLNVEIQSNAVTDSTLDSSLLKTLRMDIEEGNIKLALEKLRMIAFKRGLSKLADEAMVLLSKWNDLRKMELTETMSYEEATKRKAGITNASLNLLDQIQ